MNNLKDNDVVFKETSPWLVFKTIKNKKWFSNAIRLALTFSPKCILPAGLGLIAMCLWLAAIFLQMGRLSQINEISEVLKTLIAAMATLLICGVTYIWSITLWLARLTAVARATLSLPENSWNDVIDSNVLVAHMKDAIVQVKQRKGFMTKYYLLITLYMLAPLVCLSVCSAVVVAPNFIHVPGLVLPKWFEIASMTGFMASGTFIFILSMISLVVSSSCKPQLQKSVYKTIGLSVSCFLPCLVLSLISLVMLTLTTEPMSPFLMAQPVVFNTQTVVMLIFNFVWQSVVSIFVLPFMVTPFAELFRGRFE